MDRQQLFYALSGFFELEMLNKEGHSITPNMAFRDELKQHLASLSDKEFFRLLSEFVRERYLTEEQLNSNMADIRMAAWFIKWIEQSDITDRDFTSTMYRDFPFAMGEPVQIIIKNNP